MLSHCPHEFSIEIKVAEAAVLAIANEQQRLIVTGIYGQAMTAVEKPSSLPLPP